MLALGSRAQIYPDTVGSVTRGQAHILGSRGGVIFLPAAWLLVRLVGHMRDGGKIGVAILALGFALACGSKSTDGGSAVSVAGAPAAGSGGASSAGGGSIIMTAGTGATSGSGPDLNVSDAGMITDSDAAPGDVCGSVCPSGQTCSPEICDGIDNNCDGQIDNVDKNGDGVCDCLLIATLGNPGTWGTGDVFSTWLSARSNVGAVSLADQTLTSDLLAKYEVIVAQDLSKNHEYSSDEVAALQTWIKAGGGFMTLIGYADPGEEANVNQLLQPFTMNYGHKQILPAQGASTFPITDWTPHPIDEGVTAVGVDYGYEAQGQGTVFARGGGYNVGLAQEVLPGHVLVWGDEWITYDSEWQQHSDYQVELFWLNAIKWLTAANKCQVSIPTTIPR
jgi:hypothetical protein